MKKRFSGFEFWDGAVFGTLIGVVATLGLSWGLAGLSEEYWSVFGAIFAVIATLSAALIALKGVRSQIENQDSHAANTSLQELAAYKATLPIVLSEITIITKEAIRMALQDADAVVLPQSEINQQLRLRIEALDTLRNCIKFSGGDTQRWLSVAISNYQICYARSGKLGGELELRSGVGGENAAIERVNIARDWALQYAIISHLFPYGRGEVDQVPSVINLESMRHSYSLDYLHTNSCADFNAEITRVINHENEWNIDKVERIHRRS